MCSCCFFSSQPAKWLIKAGKYENDTENGLLQTGNDSRRLNDEVLIESRSEVNHEEEEDPLHPTEA